MSIISFLFGKNKKPEKEKITINDSLGEFVAEEKDCAFEGNIEWLGKSVTVFIEKDGENCDKPTANESLSILRRLVENAEEWDMKLKNYVADDFEEDGMIEIWGSPEQLHEEVPPIKREEFISRISLCFADIQKDGNIYFDYSLDEMFTDHGECIYANISGEIYSCGLQG